ncbi:MAG TPA: hypothetical protein VF459_07370 [Caulobacteraceae bacterium]
MRIAPLPAPTAEHVAVAGLAAAGSGAAWYVLLMRKFVSATASGPVCGHETLLGPHCQSCYAALGLAGVGLSLLLAAEARRAPKPVLRLVK